MKLHAVFLVVLIFISCSSAGVQKKRSHQAFSEVDKNKISELMKAVESFNEHSPQTLSMNMVVFAQFKNRKYKAYGKALYNLQTKNVSVVFLDYIFKSPLLKIYQNDTILKFYYPADKRIFLDNTNTIQLSNYGGLNLDFSLLYDMAIGKIPVIEDYAVNRIVKFKDVNSIYLILENDTYFQTLSFRGKKVDKIMLVNKSTKGKYEIFIDRYSRKNNRVYFRELRFVNKMDDVLLRINVTRYVPDRPLRIKILNEKKMSRDIQIIRM